MWSRASSERAAGAASRGRRGQTARWLWAALSATVLAACGSHAVRDGTASATPPASAAQASKAPVTSAPAATAANAASAAASTSGTAGVNGAGTTPLATHPDVPAPARADFDRAVNYMRGGNAAEAELDFKQVALQYPQFAAPLVNLALLQRKQGQLEQAEQSLKSAVSHESASAVAWTELGVTQRMRGEFKDAQASYEQAIAVDARYAPAWRNLGVLMDLYLNDPNRALTAFEQYKQLTGEDKPVSGWIAELRQRLGIATPKKPAAAGAAPGSAAGAAPADATVAPADGAPAATPQAPPPQSPAGNAAPQAGG
jgi:tetratricopeptide (TPR) repeat protein